MCCGTLELLRSSNYLIRAEWTRPFPNLKVENNDFVNAFIFWKLSYFTELDESKITRTSAWKQMKSKIEQLQLNPCKLNKEYAYFRPDIYFAEQSIVILLGNFLV